MRLPGEQLRVRLPEPVDWPLTLNPGIMGATVRWGSGVSLVPERFDVSLLILRLAQQCMPVLDDVNGRGPSLSIDGLSSKKALPIRGHVVWPD